MDKVNIFENFKSIVYSDMLKQAKNIIVLALATLLSLMFPFVSVFYLFPMGSAIMQLILPFLVALVYLFGAWWIFFARGREMAGYTLSTLMAGMVMLGISLAVYPNGDGRWETITRVAGALGALITALETVNLAFDFPHIDPFVDKYFVSRLTFSFIIFLQFILFAIFIPFSRPMFLNIQLVLSTLALLFFMFWMGGRYIRQLTYIEKEQAMLVMVAIFISFAPAVLLLAAFLVNGSYLFSPYFLLFALAFPLLIGSMMYRSGMMSSNYVLQRTLVYGALFIILSVGYALMVTGLGLIFNLYAPTDNPLVTGLVIFLLALLFDPLRRLLRNAVDRLFFKGEKVYQDSLRDFSSDLTRVVGLLEIIKVVRKYLNLTLSPAHLHIYIYDPLSEQFVATLDEKGEITSDLRFAGNSPLVQYLGSTKKPLIIEKEDLSLNLIPEKPRLALLNSVLYVPFNNQGKLSGWISLGRSLNGEMYRLREVNFVQTISDQAALAIERAQVVANLEDRVREMNVLSRVSQGINITLMLDDILELIYAQTTQIISADDFQIVLLDERTHELIKIFDVQENDRLTQNENKPLGNAMLEQEVIRLRRPIVTADYAKECQIRNISPAQTGVFTWMGVPLNAGAGTIGALSLAKRDNSIVYTYQQLVLLQSIADQAAGAIVKARLLEETQRRARQLQSLNEVSRQLTSTLELNPLLKNILASAGEILNCEAGGLLMLDENSDELVFRVTVGTIAQPLLNLHVPRDGGLLGKVMSSHEALLVNDPQGLAEWTHFYEEQIDFVTRSLMLVPLLVMDRMIGAIGVVNKRDFSPFSGDDRDLLMAFAGQAAIAIENARLYQMTDQELADRVEELSVLQRIGRELNTSLDIQKATTITLDWAIRHARASAGILGLVKENDIEVFSQQGILQDATTAPAEIRVNLFSPGVIDAIEKGLPQRLLLNSANLGLTPSSMSRIVIPIRRETATTGVIILEFNHSNPLSEDLINFLLRLSDQAAIAIANAQLYDAVQAANVAKSEFVSFVSHELKNPMTSIKGYTELIAAGAVGPINEAQANFLSTIRSNVERMATLVSDLADISRIEADRLKLDFKALNSKELLEEVLRSLRRQFEDKSLEIEINYPDDTPLVWGDKTRMIQVMTNLLSNACKYTPNGGKVMVSAEATSNIWDESGAPRVLHMCVRDTGIGISEEDQRKIFQKFFRSEDPKTREAPGTGLGLSITKSLVEKQGGKIWFESEFRKGTAFHFTVPVSA
ncbi:MAG: GAF domain-containing protein [Anaerolineae bacterium]|nr:GAF domain-containing protein [Anaerolineae bacterium]